MTIKHANSKMFAMVSLWINKDHDPKLLNCELKSAIEQLQFSSENIKLVASIKSVAFAEFFSSIIVSRFCTDKLRDVPFTLDHSNGEDDQA